MQVRPAQSGFSLVELSIVLVILGLLTGGILGGQALIRAAELRSLTADVQRYSAAYHSFRDKYFALPGDMTNATAFWQVRAGTGSDVACHQAINSTLGTCNGNGDGQIDYITGDLATFGERWAAWQHLARAGLIEGNYTGASGSSTTFLPAPGTNIPRGRIPNSQIRFAWIGGPLTGHAELFDGSYSYNHFELVGSPSNAILRPEELWNLDTKLDDGRPANGAVFTVKNTSSWGPGCATTDVVSTAAYSLNNANILCVAYIALR